MRFIIELDGVIFDLAAAWHQAHRQAAEAVGWSRLDEASFWRTMRTKGESGNFLPGAKPVKCEKYAALFSDTLESDDIINAFAFHDGVHDACKALRREGVCIGMATGANLERRRHRLEHAGLDGLFAEVQPLDANPRRRPLELRALSDNDPRTVVVTSSDVPTRSADAAGLFCVGISSGTCNPARLHQAGVRLVFSSLGDFAAAARQGAARLVSAGLPPERLG